nr:uncharacterized protein LOC104647095 [Solanum lycopersicum]
MSRAAAARGNQNPPQAPAKGVAMLVNPARLTDAEVRASLAHMAQAITMQAQAMTAQVNRQNVQRENPPVRSMADRLRDFRSMNPPLFRGAKTLKDPQEFIDEVHKILVAMGATDIEKAEQEEESRKRKHTRVGNKARQVDENFSRKSSTKIRDNPKFKKELSHQGDSSSFKGLHDRNSESRVKRNNELDTPQKRQPCNKYGKLHGGECMRGTNACYRFVKW